MKQYAFLEYTFIFDPETTWSSANKFEDDLENFFAAHTMDAQVVNGVTGQMGKKLILVQRMDPLAQVLNQPNGETPTPTIAPAPKVSSKTPSQILNQMGQTKGYNGKFKKVNT